MQIVITRPAEQAHDWVRRLHAEGVRAVALPLIGIEPVDDPEPLRLAWQQLPGKALAMFVSANAVQHFFALRPPDQPWPDGVLAGCTGPGTAVALEQAGVPARWRVAPAAEGPFDSEGLWAQLAARDWAGRRALVVRGEAGRDWLADRLQAAGAEVSFLAAYRRVGPRLDAAEAQAVLATAAAQPQQMVWHFSSSEAAGNLRQLGSRSGPDATVNAPDWSCSVALATHPRIAEAVRQLGFARVEPLDVGLDAVVAWWRRHVPVG